MIKSPASTESQKTARESQKSIYLCFTEYAEAFECVDHNELGKILKKKGISDHLPCLLRNLYVGQEAAVKTRFGTQTGSKLWKEYSKSVSCHCAYLTSMQSTSCKMLGWKNHKLESRLPGPYVDDTTLMAESKEKLKSFSMKVKEESEKLCLKPDSQKTIRIMASSPNTSWQIEGNSERIYFLGLQSHCGWWWQPWNQKTFAPWKKSYDKPRQNIKSQRHHFADKHSYNQSYGFSSKYVWMWELDRKEGWALKNWCFWTVVLEKTLGSLLDSKEIKPVSHKANEPWIFIGRIDGKAPIICPPDANIRLIGKDPDAGKDWRQEKRGTTEDGSWIVSWIQCCLTWVWTNSRR